MANLLVTAGQATLGSSNWTQLAVNFALQSFGPSGEVREGSRLKELQVLRATEGNTIARLYGRMRLGGQLIWADTVQEHAYETGGGKGNSQTGKQRSYSYITSFAIALCEGEISHIGQIWADGVGLDLGTLEYTVYSGIKTQESDPIIQAALGIENTPAYRGLAYIVFHNFNLTEFGNRIPQFNFEVFSKLNDETDFIQAVNLIPGATEFGYDPNRVIQVIGKGVSQNENTHISLSKSDWEVAIDDLQAKCPKCKCVSLVVTWFGTDLRAEHCRIQPRVESKVKNTAPETWSVAGVDRSMATVVSTFNNRPAYGGTPNDMSVKRAIQDLKQRGFKVLFYPFIMMDIPEKNGLTDPYGEKEQKPYPWRGHITSNIAPSQNNNIDATSAIEQQISKFFYGDGTEASPQWGLAHMIEHYAHLCAEAGGVDAFLVGSELVQLSKLRSQRGKYPFATYLTKLAKNVKKILPNTKISYAADWTEYGAHFVSGNNDLGFPLDEFWADSNVDFIGIDQYAPLADWREGTNHQDIRDGYNSIYDIEYLKSNIEGGIYYNWYYQNEADRENQIRTDITDGLNKPWVFRSKDIKNWWKNTHIQRQNNVETTATNWQAEEKPIWFTEIGCPAVDKGPNEPNRFPDNKSSDSGLPYASNGQRDDEIQLRFLKAISEYWNDENNNPISNIYNDPMVLADQMCIWAWDARPYPTFPLNTDVWVDGELWARGHWINGRLSAAPLSAITSSLTHNQIKLATEADRNYFLEGYVVDQIATPREMLEPLLQAFALKPIKKQTGISLYPMGELDSITITDNQHVVSSGLNNYQITRGDVSELPSTVKVSYIDYAGEYQPASVEARRPSQTKYVMSVDLPMVLRSGQAQEIAERILAEIWIEQESLKINLPINEAALQAGDIIKLNELSYRMVQITDTNMREIDAVRYERSLYNQIERLDQNSNVEVLSVISIPEVWIVNLPPFEESNAAIPYVAAFAQPWGKGVQVENKINSWSLDIEQAAILGETQNNLLAGPNVIWDRGNILEVKIFAGTLDSHSENDVLSGANKLAVETENGWEIIQFCNAELVDNFTYRLSKLLRGQFGSEAIMENNLGAGARVILLNSAVASLPVLLSDLPEEMNLVYGSSEQNKGEYTWKNTNFLPNRIGLKPFAPTYLKVKVDELGDRHITWIRRSRVGGDNWVPEEIPLGENSEKYLVEFKTSGLLVRSFLIDIPYLRYIASKFNIDKRFGSLEVTVVQIGDNNIRGYGTTKTIYQI